MAPRNLQSEVAAYLSLIRELQADFYFIARASESFGIEASEVLRSRAERAINLIDSYLMSSQMEAGQTALPLTTFAVGSLMHSAAYELRATSGNDVTIKTGINYPVYTSSELLRNLLLAIAQFIGESTKSSLVFRSFAVNSDGVGVGVFAKNLDLNTSNFRDALQRVGCVNMAMPKLSNGSGVMLVLADKVALLLDTELKVKHMGKYSGLSIVLPKSVQLSLI